MTWKKGLIVIVVMLRILLAVDDYNELVFLQTLLKKIGFDVDGVQNQRNLEEGLLGFNPEVLLALGEGKRIRVLDMAASIRKVRGIPKIVALLSGEALRVLKDKELAGVDALIETPVQVHALLTTLAQLGGLDAKVLIDKYNKIRVQLSEPQAPGLPPDLRPNEEEGEYKGSAESLSTAASNLQSSMSPEERQERNKTVLEKMESPDFDGFSRERVGQFHRQIRAEENLEDTEELEKQRQAFVKILFQSEED